jgi:hypothetical protein
MNLNPIAPRPLLHLEGAALLALSVVLYFGFAGGHWLLFAALLLAPDLAMLGYLAGPRAGAAAYNLFHTMVLPIALALAGFALGQPPLLQVGLIWLAHIGMDRAIGYGLKYSTAFKDTHLQRV